MSFTHTITQTWVRSNDQISQATVITDDGENNRDIVVAGVTTDELVTITLTVANIKSLFILSDKDMTLKTNSSGSPANTVNLKANQPLIWWSTASYFANPFTVDVTKFYLTNADAAAANFKFRCILHAGA